MQKHQQGVRDCVGAQMQHHLRESAGDKLQDRVGNHFLLVSDVSQLQLQLQKTFRCDTSTKTECATSYETSYEKYCSTIYKKVRSTLNILKFENEARVP